LIALGVRDVGTADDETYMQPTEGRKKRTAKATEVETEPQGSAIVKTEDGAKEPRRVTRATAKALGVTVPKLTAYF
jgi:hypothetical protein